MPATTHDPFTSPSKPAAPSSPAPPKTGYEGIGKALLIIGLLGFAVAAVVANTPMRDVDNGTLPAVSFLFIILGMCFAFPDMLQDEAGGFSTMRVVVLITVLIFAVVTLKLAWGLKTFDEWRIDRTWIYILGLAFGGKAFQKYSEIEGAKNEADAGKGTGQ
jgi:hypothetical protein